MQTIDNTKCDRLNDMCVLLITGSTWHTCPIFRYRYILYIFNIGIEKKTEEKKNTHPTWNGFVGRPRCIVWCVRILVAIRASFESGKRPCAIFHSIQLEIYIICEMVACAFFCLISDFIYVMHMRLCLCVCNGNLLINDRSMPQNQCALSASPDSLTYDIMFGIVCTIIKMPFPLRTFSSASSTISSRALLFSTSPLKLLHIIVSLLLLQCCRCEKYYIFGFSICRFKWTKTNQQIKGEKKVCSNAWMRKNHELGRLIYKILHLAWNQIAWYWKKAAAAATTVRFLNVCV